MTNHDRANSEADGTSSASERHGESKKYSAKSATDVDHSMESEFHRLLTLGRQLVGAAGDLLGLARVEAALALSALPKVGVIALLAIPIGLLSWISFSALVAWGAFQWLDSFGVAILAFFLVQVITLVVFVSLVKKWIQDMKFTYTKNNFAKFAKEFSNGSKGASESEKQSVGASARHH